MSTRGKQILSFVLGCVIGLLWAGSAGAAYLRNVPQSLTQPDGTPLQLLASGDEYYNWLHDERGFVIVQNPETGWLEYAVKVNGLLEPSGIVVGRGDPVAAGLAPGLRPDPGLLPRPEELFPHRRPASVGSAAAATAFSAIKNVVIFIRFSDQAAFTDPISFYDGVFNASAAGSVSVYAYYREESYQKLSVHSSFFPTPSGGIVASYKDAQPRSYYMPYNAATNPNGYPTGDNVERARREHTLLANAIAAVSSQVPTSLDVDNNGDGMVDNVVFVVRGQPTAWNTILWPHQWDMASLYPMSSYINNKLVQSYNFQLEVNGSGEKLVVGVLCHELAHTLGAPDLYHYSTCSSAPDLSPAYKWDLMEVDLTPPQHHTAFVKHKYLGFIPTIETISQSGVYSLNPLTSSSNNAWRINSPNSSTEYFMVEYRRKTGVFESSLPNSGLLVYRIKTDLPQGQEGNDCGPPDELYVYRPGGTTTADGTPDDAPLGADTMRDAINASTDPAPFLSSGAPGGLDISEVRESGSTVSFRVTVSSSGETTVFQEGFEGSFPGQWQRYKPSGKADTEWGRSTYRKAAGSGSAWCAGGGTNPQPAGGDYVPNMGTWLYYGPFSLAGATDAWAEFDLWLETEASYDKFKWMISVNDVNYYGKERSTNTNGWEHIRFNFKDVTNIAAIGAAQVWLGFIFESDTGTQYEGAYVDNVVIKRTSGTPTCTYAITPTSQSFSASSGSGSFSVTANVGCTWTASSNAAWIQVTQGASGTGNGQVAFSVSANAGASRTGTITAAGKTFTVTQVGAAVTCTYSYWVPVGSHASGAASSQWRSDLSILNRSTSSAPVDVRLYTTGGMLSRSTTLAGGAAEILRDAVAWVSPGFSGSGAIQVCSGQPLFVTERTYNLVAATASCYPGGTFGQFYDSIQAGGGLGAGQTGWLPGLSESPSFRCNIGLTNTGAAAAAVTVTLHNQDGTSIGSYQVTLNPGEWKQETQPFKTKAGQTDLDRGYAKVTVNSGSGVIAYASVIDNRTNDPITVPAKQ